MYKLINDSEMNKEFFKLKDIDRDNVLWWMNKITGSNYNVCRRNPQNSASPMILCLGDVVIMEQE